MTDVLAKEILGEQVTVAIRGSVHPLAYPMHNVILYKQRTGDSLFDAKVWPRIDLQQDPERWLACLWAGMHQQQTDKSWKAPLTLEELGGLIDFRNAGEISTAMVNALIQFMPRADPDPKAPAPGELAQSDPTTAVPISESSSPVQDRDLVGVGRNS
jgi:hypothetical protein